MSSLLWQRVADDLGCTSTPEAIARLVFRQAGVDVGDLTVSDFLDCWNDQYRGDWQELAWTFQEMLASMSCAADAFDEDDIVVASLVISFMHKANRLNAGSAEFDQWIRYLVTIAAAMRDRIDVELLIELIYYPHPHDGR